MTLTTKYSDEVFPCQLIRDGKKDNKTQTPMACDQLVLRLYEIFTVTLKYITNQ